MRSRASRGDRVRPERRSVDELDAIAPAREQSAASDDMMSSRVVATLLSIFGGGEGRWAELNRRRRGTTNRPDAIERALRRPGRFDRELEVGCRRRTIVWRFYARIFED